MQKLLFASDYFAPKKPDEQYESEAEAFVTKGCEYATINTDELSSAKPIPLLNSGETVLYRGWMLNTEGYGCLVNAIEKCGALPVTNRETYLATHHIPNWCALLSDLTPETVVLPLGSDFESELKALDWPAYFVKDYVKSLKTATGSIITKPEQLGELMAEMEKYRGEIEGGLCIRKVEDFIENSETRYFVVDGVPHSPNGGEIPEVVLACVERISSPFFSVDVAKRSDGVDRVVEVGDGQVSDLVGWSVERFVEIFD